ncbi:MAG: flippase-like domain-containing protein, partial [Muribaculaceae bacterium]|nr:flippase-like domain-containing protein [Muribaculaceae bacterium]
DALLTYFIDNAATLEAIKSIVFSPWRWCIAIAILASLWWLFSHKTNNKLIAKIQRAIKGLWVGFAVIIKMPGKWRWFEWTLCVWGCYFTQLLVAMMAFPSTRDVIANHGLSAALVTFALSSLSMGVPSNGGIGPWQWAVIFALGIYGVENATAGAFANVVLGTQTLMQILLGIFTFIMIALDKRRNKIKINKTTNIENV